MNTATVETLTAEVRVLMVGNRQITLSVAKQLDRCGLEFVEPFGRITMKEFPDSVIGRSLRTKDAGALVVARYRKRRDDYADEDLMPRIWLEDLSEPITVCDKQGSAEYNEDYYKLFLLKRAIHVAFDAAKGCGMHPYESKDRCNGWSDNGQLGVIQDCIDKSDAIWALHERAKELPLIVLAGLR